MRGEMEEFTDLLIAEVEKRPALYSFALPEYKDRDAKVMLWEEVCRAVFPDWGDLDARGKTAKKKDVQRRWKSLRDSFRREVAIQKDTSRSGSNKRHKYIYFNQLQFLLRNLGQKPAKSSVIKRTSSAAVETESANGEDTGLDCLGQQTTGSKPPRPTQVAQKAGANTLEKRLLHLLEKRSAAADEADDDDRQFLLSLLPVMKTFDYNEKLRVRVEVLNTIRKVQDEINNKKMLPKHHIVVQPQIDAT